MTGSAWESLLNRTRARRDRLCGDEPECMPEPAPAHELTIRHLEAGRRGLFLVPPYAQPLDLLLSRAIDTAHFAELTALELDTPWSRQLADEALSFCLRVAARIISRNEGRT